MAKFEIAYAPLKEFEGGYSNVAADRGGETYAGIARNFFGAWAGWPIVDAQKARVGTRASTLNKVLAAIPELQQMVADWYRTEWWDRLGLEALPQELANEIFEQSVNLGRGGAGKLVQTMCNAFNYDKAAKGRIFDDLKVDGAIGPKTLNALKVLVSRRTNEAALVHALNCLQGTHYLNLAANKSSQRIFTDGWMTRTHDPEAAK